MIYARPLAQFGTARPAGALSLAGGAAWFTHAECLSRTDAAHIIAARDLPSELLDRLTRPRGAIGGVSLDGPAIMGILNVTPDSFSDGGVDKDAQDAIRRGQALFDAGADIVDIGGESTRPGAAPVPVDEEMSRITPVFRALAKRGPTSADTRKAAVAEAALDLGAVLINDVSGLTHDPDLAPLCAARQVPVCAMHTLGDPQEMQLDPRYDNVVLDVYDTLDAHINRLIQNGIPRDRIVIDPGIGFGKTLEHNLALISHLSLFHGLGCAILLGVSRKGFIGRIGQAPEARARAPGSIAVGLSAVAQGVQILRVHDVEQTRQALSLWQAATTGTWDGS